MSVYAVLKLKPSTTFSVTTSSQKILDTNTRARYREITNSSDTGIWLAFGEAAVVGKGVYLGPSGWSYAMSLHGDNHWQGEVYAIHGGTGTKTIGIIEGQ